MSFALAMILTGMQFAEAYMPPNGVIPNESVAVRVGELLLGQVYGEDKIASERPFKAKLIDGVWLVEGTLYCPGGKLDDPQRPHCLGGVTEIKIKKSDGQVLNVIHGK